MQLLYNLNVRIGMGILLQVFGYKGFLWLKITEAFFWFVIFSYLLFLVWVFKILWIIVPKLSFQSFRDFCKSFYLFFTYFYVFLMFMFWFLTQKFWKIVWKNLFFPPKFCISDHSSDLLVSTLYGTPDILFVFWISFLNFVF